MSMHDDILALINKYGALGVNSIQKELNLPLSTVQYYLTKQQSYFIKNDQRKWDLPENVVNKSTSEMSDNAQNLLKSQLVSVRATQKLVSQQIDTLVSLIETILPNLPVAGKSGKSDKLDKRMYALQEILNTYESAVKQYKDNIPEEYYNLFVKFDMYQFMFDKSNDEAQEFVDSYISAVLLGDLTELDESVLEVIEQYQKTT